VENENLSGFEGEICVIFLKDLEVIIEWIWEWIL